MVKHWEANGNHRNQMKRRDEDAELHLQLLLIKIIYIL